MNTTVALNIAQTGKKDEFYTQLNDIEEELKYYKTYFNDKVVYCNCDDYKRSNFTKYFVKYFKELNLKRLISTCYKSNSNNLFLQNQLESSFYIDYDGSEETLQPKKLMGDGDFRSAECLKLLEQADVIVTNPPFSLFRDFVSLLFRYKKDFLIIGNVNAISYKECFEHILKNEMWLGQSIHSGDREFQVPDDYPLEASGFRVDNEGKKFIRVKGVRWFTNIDIEKRHKWLTLTKKYEPHLYPKFDNIEAINVGKTKDIPYDYEGVMGVPITFLDWYNPEQFELIGNEYSLNVVGGRGYINGKRMYSRIFIKRNLKTSDSQIYSMSNLF